MKGYWNQLMEIVNVFVDGVLCIGDVGYFDVDGYLFIVDWIKDMIFCGGYNVYLWVIEEVLYEYFVVVEVVVIGVFDVYCGQSFKVFVILVEGVVVIGDELCVFLCDKISKIEFFCEVEICDILFKMLIGKFFKKEFVVEEFVKVVLEDGRGWY